MITVRIEIRWTEWDFFLDWVRVCGDRGKEHLWHGHINWQLKHSLLSTVRETEVGSMLTTLNILSAKMGDWQTPRGHSKQYQERLMSKWLFGWPIILIISEDRQCSAHNNLHLYDYLWFTNIVHLLFFFEPFAFSLVPSQDLSNSRVALKLGPVI